jgi:GATA zinc finger
MAPRKTAPLPVDLLLSKRGIVFSLNVFQEDQDFEPVLNDQLQVSIHKVTSSMLLTRMDKTRLDLGIAPLVERKEMVKKRKINATTTTAGECTWCGVKKTAQWRKGPTGARGLCNVSFYEILKDLLFMQDLLYIIARSIIYTRSLQILTNTNKQRCGIEWAKQIRYEAKTNGVSNSEAEARLVYTYKDTDRFKRFAREHLALELVDFQR